MKKIIVSLIVSLLLLSVCIVAAVPASAAEGVNYDDWLIYDGAIVGYCGSDAEVVVPTKDADGLPITSIGPNAFAGKENAVNTTLEKVVIPEGITEIGGRAFEYCASLTEVSLPYSLKKAGGAAFRRCENLVSIVIPGNLKIVPKDFTSGSPLTELVISYGVEEITCDAFGGTQTTEIVFPETVCHIGAGAFNAVGKETGERLEIYITNDDCALGVKNEDSLFFAEDYPAKGGIVHLTHYEGGYNKATKIHIYGLKDGSVKEYVKQYMNDAAGKPWEYAVFHGISADDLAEKNEWCKENGILEPEDNKANQEDKDNNDEDNNDNDDNSSSDKKNDKTDSSSSDMSQMMMIMMIGMGGLVLIIIIVVVVVLVVMMGKKKKKKKKKAKVEAPIEEAPVEEAASVEEVAEEKGEEE